jgi:hypothetical protein
MIDDSPPARGATARDHNPPPLGERAVEAAILELVATAGPGKSISPSEAAQALGPDWRAKLTAVRRAAQRLAEAGRIDILRKGKRVEPSEAKGVVRLALPHQTPMTET